jgi:hypothetical protein
MLNPTLFIGTTLGSVIIVIINLPDRGDPRVNEPVVVSPSGSLIRIRGPMLTMAFLDSSIGTLTTRGCEPLENVHTPARPSSTSPPAGAGKEEVTPTGDQQVLNDGSVMYNRTKYYSTKVSHYFLPHFLKHAVYQNPQKTDVYHIYLLLHSYYYGSSIK